MAVYIDKLGHDTINRYMRKNKITPHLIEYHANGGFLILSNKKTIFDGTTFDKNYFRHANKEHTGKNSPLQA